METKKAWEILTSRPSLFFRPSHCPQPRISNAASPRQVIIYITNGYTLIIYSISGDIINPRKRFRCITSVVGFKGAKFEEHRTVTSVNAFSLGLLYKQHRRPQEFHRCNVTPPAHYGLALSAAKLRIICESAKKNREKI